MQGKQMGVAILVQEMQKDIWWQFCKIVGFS